MTNTGGSIIPAKEFEGKLWILADAYQQAMQAAYMGGILAERERILDMCKEGLWDGEGQWYICPKCSYQAPRFKDEWVGLTDEELLDLADMAYANDLELLQTLQVKLKEKNT